MQQQDCRPKMTNLIHLACMLVLYTYASAIEFYKTVEGNCSDLPTVQKFDDQRIASGEWYYQYASYGKEGDRCSTGHSVARGNQHYIDALLFDPNKNRYIRFADDLTYHPDQPGVYTNDAGAVGHVLTSDLLSYFYYVQCVQNTTTEVVAVFATREPEVDKKAEQIYKEFTARLEKIKLLPTMHKINHTNCPPKYMVEIDKPT